VLSRPVPLRGRLGLLLSLAGALVFLAVLVFSCGGNDSPSSVDAAEPSTLSDDGATPAGDQLDGGAVGLQAAKGSSSGTASSEGEAGLQALPQVSRSWRRIVIDAGHGGTDTGAEGVSGALEKEVTLGIARGCARDLRKLGFEVIETRTSDHVVRLERRSAAANAKGAGIFVSIHANSAARSAVQGVETYYMDLSSDEAASRLAERENRARSVAGDPSSGSVETMIADLRMGAYAKHSRALARKVHRQLVSGLRELYGRERISDRGVRTAPFWVLLDSQMPAVLVEVGYLTNSAEERRMRTHGFQRHAARAIATAVAEFAEQAEAAEPASGHPMQPGGAEAVAEPSRSAP